MGLPLEALRALSPAEIRARLHELRTRRAPRRVPFAWLAAQAGVSRPTLYSIVRGGPLKDSTRKVLSIVLISIEWGTLLCARHGQTWRTERKTPPAQLPPPQAKLLRADEWNEWAPCRSCGARRDWRAARAAVGGRRWQVCAACIPPGQWPSLGLDHMGAAPRRGHGE